jgi:SAM-dependent methyltransferase
MFMITDIIMSFLVLPRKEPIRLLRGGRQPSLGDNGLVTEVAAVDAGAWLRRWDAQQQRHIPDREERFRVIVDAVAAACGNTPRVLDLGSGPGSLAARVLERLPGAEVVAIDADPVLLAIGREALRDSRNLHFVDADLRADWEAGLPVPGPFDAAVSTTALHWLSLTDLVRLYRRLARLLRPGGVLLDGDKLDYGPSERRVAEIARAVQPAAGDGEDWEAWWSAALEEPWLAGAAAERSRRGHDHPHDQEAHSLAFHSATLLACGFAETATIWQHGANRVLLAVR